MPEAFTGSTVEKYELVEQPEQELVRRGHAYGLMAHTTRIFLNLFVLGAGFPPILCRVEVAEASFATSCLALRTLQDVAHNSEANRTLKVFKLDVKPSIRVEIFLFGSVYSL